MLKQAIYPGSFDPITLGHVDIIQRAAKLFDKIIILVAKNDQKTGLFSTTERLALCEKVLKDFPNIEFCESNGLIIDFAKEKNIHIILRGVRTAADVDFEMQLAHMNRDMAPQVETLLIPSSQHYTYVSSSLIKEIAKLGKDVSQFVPTVVATAIKEKLSHVAR